MLYARKITEDGWFGKDNLDADSVSELGTTNHKLSVWKISDVSNSELVDSIALALALTRSKVEEFYMILLNPSEIKKSCKWIVSIAEQDGDTRYSNMKGEHVNFIVSSFWEQGYLAEYIHKLIQNDENYLYYDVAKLKKMAYDAVRAGKLTMDDIKNEGSGKSDKGDGSHIWKDYIKSLYAHPFLPSPQPVSDVAVCLCKSH